MTHHAEDEVGRLQGVLQALTAIGQFRGRAAELIPMVLDQAMTLTGASGMAFERLDGTELVTTFTAGSLADHVGTRVPREGSLSGLAVDTRLLQAAPDAFHDSRVSKGIARDIGAASAIVVPIDFSGAAVGVLLAVWRQSNAFTHAEVETLALLGDLTSASIGRQVLLERNEDASKALARALGLAEHRDAEHRQAAESDALTGLPNRHALDAALRVAVSHWSPQQGSAVLFIDLNGFKQINDRYGHAAGDTALQRMAEILRRCTRGHDLVARIGGDEFVVLLNRLASPAIHTAVAAERIHDAVLADNALNSHLPELKLTLGAALIDRAGLDAIAVMAEADAAMAAEKRSA